VLILTQSRTLAASAFFLSIGVYTGMLPGYYVIWHTPYILQFPPQLWRLVTSFLITGKDLSILFDTYFRKIRLGVVHMPVPG
jgi:Derlin-2/3